MSTVSHPIAYSVPGKNDRRATLHYDTRRPLDVRVDFGAQRTGEDPCVWTFARDLLADGFDRMAGLGDVCCWTEDGFWYYVALSSPYGDETMRFVAESVRYFLAETEDLVRFGDEVISIDAALQVLLTRKVAPDA